MVTIIVNNFAYRMLENGTYQSAKVSANQDGDRVVMADTWTADRSYQELNVFDGEIAIVYETLKRLSMIPFADIPVVDNFEEKKTDLSAQR